MELYAGIDLHSNNSVVSVLDEHDRTVFAKRLPNDLAAIIEALRSCAATLHGVAVESTASRKNISSAAQGGSAPIKPLRPAVRTPR